MNKEMIKKITNIIVDIFAPLIVITLLVNAIILIGWFVFWETSKLYIPFTYPQAHIGERIVIVMGILNAIISKHED